MLVRGIRFAVPMLTLTLTLTAGIAAAQPVIVAPAPTPVQSQIIIAPNAPPPLRVETIPPPPSAESQVMYWRPGHWAWDGASWSWAEGQYVQRPAPQAIWQPGHWVQQPTGGYVWVDGHWA